MHVNVARAPELRIFELVPFEVRQAVAHIRLAREERLLPDDRTIAPDSAHAFDMLGWRADQQLGPEGRRPQLGMGEPQIIVALGYMVTELIGQGETEPAGHAIGTDQVDASKLRLLATILRGARHGQR